MPAFLDAARERSADFARLKVGGSLFCISNGRSLRGGTFTSLSFIGLTPYILGPGQPIKSSAGTEIVFIFITLVRALGELIVPKTE
jgi:hypothetical protein